MLLFIQKKPLRNLVPTLSKYSKMNFLLQLRLAFAKLRLAFAKLRLVFTKIGLAFA